MRVIQAARGPWSFSFSFTNDPVSRLISGYLVIPEDPNRAFFVDAVTLDVIPSYRPGVDGCNSVTQLEYWGTLAPRDIAHRIINKYEPLMLPEGL